MTELMRALVSTASRISPGVDGIPPDILKKGGSELRGTLLLLHNICLHCGQVPQDFRDGLVITIYKKEGDLVECGNYRGISLLAFTGKIFAKMISSTDCKNL